MFTFLIHFSLSGRTWKGCFEFVSSLLGLKITIVTLHGGAFFLTREASTDHLAWYQELQEPQDVSLCLLHNLSLEVIFSDWTQGCPFNCRDLEIWQYDVNMEIPVALVNLLTRDLTRLKQQLLSHPQISKQMEHEGYQIPLCFSLCWCWTIINFATAAPISLCSF